MTKFTKPKMNKCKYCKTKNNLTVDHKIPKIQGGTNDLKNLQCLCLRCNTMKSALSDKQVRSLFNWFLDIQVSRIHNGSKPYGMFYK
jgi:5-methylcytosine-specific restriction endonuclease McrA